MIIYLSIPILVILLSKFLNKEKINFYDLLIIVILIIVCGLRKDVGTDYSLYKKMYNNLLIFPNVEVFFKTLINICNTLNFSDNIFFFITATISIILFYISLKYNSSKPAESILLFVCLGYYAHCFNMIRQMLAISIVLYGIKYIKNNNLIKYYLCVLIAGLFHTSAFIMVPFYFVSRKNLRKITLKILYLLMCFGSLMYKPIFNYVTFNFARYKSYSIKTGYTFSEAGIGTIVNLIFHCILIAVIIMYRDKLVNRNEQNKYYINMCIFSLFFYFMALGNTVAVRFAYYFSIYLVFILPDLFRIIFKRNFSKKMNISIIFMIIYYVMHLASFNSMLPYNMIFL